MQNLMVFNKFLFIWMTEEICSRRLRMRRGGWKRAWWEILEFTEFHGEFCG